MTTLLALVDDMPDNECTCGADDAFNIGYQKSGCYMHELQAALTPPAPHKPKTEEKL